jgi:DNA repair protein RadC
MKETILNRIASERPRERLLGTGSQGLSDCELLSIVLGTGGQGRPALVLAREILQENGGLAGLVGMAPTSLRRRGLGPAKAAAVLAVLETARRLARAEVPSRDPLSQPAAVADYLRLRYSRKDQEVMGALYLDSRNRLIAEHEIFCGTLSRAAVEPRAILKRALQWDAAGLILFHTHPSGDPTPSAEDVAFTRRMSEAGEIVGARLVDHLVLGGRGRWVSLRRMGEC